MSLKHNPFDNSPKGSLIKRKKVFESPTPEPAPAKSDVIASSPSTESTAAPPSPLEKSSQPQIQKSEDRSELFLQRQSRESLEMSESISRESGPKEDFSRESPVVNRESLQRQSRESLEKNGYDLTRIVGLQRRVLSIVFSILQSKGLRVSPPIAIGLISERANTTVANTQNAIKELIKKGVLLRKEFQRGRGGWTVYEIEASTFAQLDQEKIRESLESLQRFSSIEMGAKSRETPPCSSSDLNLNNTTTTEPDFWLSVPKTLEGLVSVKQLREFVRQGLIAADELQASLDGFAFDLEKGLIKARHGNPIAILIGAIKGGGYISQQYLSELKASLAEVERARAELKQIQAEKVAGQLAAEFENFRVQFPEAAEQMKPHSGLINSFQPGSVGYRLWLEEYRKRKDDVPESKPAEL